MPKKTTTLGLSSGSTLVNLACTGKTKIAFLVGTYNLLVGASKAGKTFIVLTTLAEACQNAQFEDYDIIFDNPERGARMDFEKFFGKKLAQRLQPPQVDSEGEPVYSSTTEEFYFNLDDCYARNKPFIYILDSMDALNTREDQDSFQARKKALRKGREASGSYGTSKAKANSQGLRTAVTELPKTGSILIVICQSRDAIGVFGFGDKQTRAGGRALRFYATSELWLSIKQKIKKPVKSKQLSIGTLSKIEVKKNRVQGAERTVYVPILYSTGIDDTGSMVDYLVEWNHWKKGPRGINAIELGLCLSRDELIARIEEENLEPKLRSTVGMFWREVEESIEVRRKKRYS